MRVTFHGVVLVGKEQTRSSFHGVVLQRRGLVSVGANQIQLHKKDKKRDNKFNLELKSKKKRSQSLTLELGRNHGVTLLMPMAAKQRRAATPPMDEQQLQNTTKQIVNQQIRSNYIGRSSKRAARVAFFYQKSRRDWKVSPRRYIFSLKL
jgi:hypothetical protein